MIFFFFRYCNKTYASELLYSVHEATHNVKLLHQEEYVCHLCKKSFTNRTFLRSHILQHDFSRPYACQYCFKRFRKKSERVRNNILLCHHIVCQYVVQ